MKLFDMIFQKNQSGEITAEWYQHCFEIYCSNCHKEAKMRPDYSDYYYSRRCPHCKARMRNATIFGYKKAIKH